MTVFVEVSSGRLALVDDSTGFDERRALGAGDVETLEEFSALYRRLVAEPDAGALATLGGDLYRWLDGPSGWLGALEGDLTPPFLFEVRAPRNPDAASWSLLGAPWELLANERGFLAQDAGLNYCPARRLGPVDTAPALDDHRLGITFMASAPRGGQELDYEAEEMAVLNAAGNLGVDLVVDDSGDPEQLGERLADVPARNDQRSEHYGRQLPHRHAAITPTHNAGHISRTVELGR